MGKGWRRLVTICAAASAAAVHSAACSAHAGVGHHEPRLDSRDAHRTRRGQHGRRTPRRRDHAQQVRQGARDHRRQRRVPHRRSTVGRGRVQRTSHRLRVGELHRRSESRQDAARQVLAHADRPGAAPRRGVGYRDQDALARRLRPSQARPTAARSSAARRSSAKAHERAPTSSGRCRAFASSRAAVGSATRS